MNKVLICPDSMKGTLSASEAASIMARAIHSVLPQCETVELPVADGGEGTIDALGAKKVPCQVKGAFGEDLDSFWGILDDYAVVELAACAGLTQAVFPNPEISNTFGFGQLIADALDHGFRKFILALGGSSTNDLGCGFASALGAKFKDRNGNYFIPTGGTLKDIDSVDLSDLDSRIRESQFITMCDVTNPLYGPKGAAFVFAPQKGADDAMVQRLDDGLKSACIVFERDLGVCLSDLPGGGAAGGVGAGSVAFLNSTLKSGIETVLKAGNFDYHLENCDLILTGEGSFDSQSMDGKVISGIASAAKKKNVPVVVIAGAAKESIDFSDDGILAVFSIQREAIDFSLAKHRTEEFLEKTVKNLILLITKFSH